MAVPSSVFVFRFGIGLDAPDNFAPEQLKGELIRESTKQSNRQVARQMEAAHKTSLAKGEVGIRERKPAPTLREFATKDFLPHVRSDTTSTA